VATCPFPEETFRFPQGLRFPLPEMVLSLLALNDGSQGERTAPCPTMVIPASLQVEMAPTDKAVGFHPEAQVHEGCLSIPRT
jgi:hypothetical protein